MICHSHTISSQLERLASFAKWPVELTTRVSLIQLAADGFRYTGDTDAVICGYCDAVVRGWLGTRHSPLLEHRCPSNPATHHDEPAQHNSHVPTTGSYEETAGSRWRTAPKSKTNATPRSSKQKSCDKAARGLDAINRDSDSSCRMLDIDGVVRTNAACSFSCQMAPLGVDDVTKSTSGDVRDAAAANLANLSKSRFLV